MEFGLIFDLSWVSKACRTPSTLPFQILFHSYQCTALDGMLIYYSLELIKLSELQSCVDCLAKAETAVGIFQLYNPVLPANMYV